MPKISIIKAKEIHSIWIEDIDGAVLVDVVVLVVVVGGVVGASSLFLIHS